MPAVVQFPNLPAVTSLNGQEILAAVQAGVTKRLSVLDIIAFAASRDLTLVASLSVLPDTILPPFVDLIIVGGYDIEWSAPAYYHVVPALPEHGLGGQSKDGRFWEIFEQVVTGQMAGMRCDHVNLAPLSTATDDTAACHRWMDFGVRTGVPLLLVGGTRVTYSLGTITIPSTTTNFVLTGVSREGSYFALDGQFDDYFIDFDNRLGNWVALTSQYLPDGTFPAPTGSQKNVVLRGFSIFGSGQDIDGSGIHQLGISFSGVNDGVLIDTVNIINVYGTGCYMGLLRSYNTANIRESAFYNFKVEACGTMTEDAWIINGGIAIDFDGNSTPNENIFVNCECGISRNDSLRIVNGTTLSFYRLKIHGTNSRPLNGRIIDNITPGLVTIIETQSAHRLVDGATCHLAEITGTMAATLNDTNFVITFISNRFFSIAVDTTGLTYTGEGHVFAGMVSLTVGVVTTIVVKAHGLREGESMYIAGTTGTVSTVLNNKYFPITLIDVDTFTIAVDTSALNYTGDGYIRYTTRPPPFTGRGLIIEGGGTQPMEFYGLGVHNVANAEGQYAINFIKNTDTNDYPSHILMDFLVAGAPHNGIYIEGGSDLFLTLSDMTRVDYTDTGGTAGLDLKVLGGDHVTGPIQIAGHKMLLYDIDATAMPYMQGLSSYASLTTTGATATTLINWDLRDGHTYFFSVVVVAQVLGGAGDSATYHIECGVRCIAGTATTLAAPVVVYTGESNAAWACAFGISGTVLNRARINVTGAAVTDVFWEVTSQQVNIMATTV